MMLAAVMAAGITSCEKDSEPTPQPDPDPQPEAIGSYTFGNTEYDIRFATVYDNGSSYSFVFSPLSARPLTTYVGVALNYYFTGTETDIVGLYHNDDYSFVYEDPLHFYSQSHPLQSGKMLIKKNDDNNYTVNIDVLLNDGTPFKMEFTGDIFSEEEE